MTPGTWIDGKYRVERTLGEGGMGTVLKCWEPNRAVAIKMPRVDAPPEQQQIFARRLEREYHLLSSLDSRYVVEPLYLGRMPDKTPFMVMKYLRGHSLREELTLRKGHMRVLDALSVISDACKAVAFAHQNDIIHQDLKPSNLFLQERSDGPDLQDDTVVTLLDFGAAESSITGGEPTSLPFQGGTAGYMSPEQESGQRVGFGTDIWTLGVILYELLTGDRPEPAGDPEQGLRTIGEVRHGVEQTQANELDRIIRKCLSFDPRRRYPRVRLLQEHVDSVRGLLGPVSSIRISHAPEPDPGWTQRLPDGGKATRPENAHQRPGPERNATTGGVTPLVKYLDRERGEVDKGYRERRPTDGAVDPEPQMHAAGSDLANVSVVAEPSEGAYTSPDAVGEQSRRDDAPMGEKKKAAPSNFLADGPSDAEGDPVKSDSSATSRLVDETPPPPQPPEGLISWPVDRKSATSPGGMPNLGRYWVWVVLGLGAVCVLAAIAARELGHKGAVPASSSGPDRSVRNASQDPPSAAAQAVVAPNPGPAVSRSPAPVPEAGVRPRSVSGPPSSGTHPRPSVPPATASPRPVPAPLATASPRPVPAPLATASPRPVPAPLATASPRPVPASLATASPQSLPGASDSGHTTNDRSGSNAAAP